MHSTFHLLSDGGKAQTRHKPVYPPRRYLHQGLTAKYLCGSRVPINVLNYYEVATPLIWLDVINFIGTQRGKKKLKHEKKISDVTETKKLPVFI